MLAIPHSAIPPSDLLFLVPVAQAESSFILIFSRTGDGDDSTISDELKSDENVNVCPLELELEGAGAEAENRRARLRTNS